jgi:hypothetical protein
VALSDDQKAILRLLAQRGEQGYEDLSALMGVDPAEVHRRAQEAAAELEAEGIPAPAIPEPPGGVGEGDPPSVAKDGEAPPGGSPSPQPPPTVPAEPQEPAPEVVHSSEAPRARPKPPQTQPQPARTRGESKPPPWKELKLLEGRGLWALLAGAAIVVLFVVFVLGGGGEDGGDSTDATNAANSPSGKTVAALEAAAGRGSKEVTKASLQGVNGSDAIGVAIFGRVKKSLALQVAAEGLEPTGNGESYTIWLAASPEKMLPLASTNEVKSDGRLAAQVEVPVEVLAYLANETFGQIAITRTDDSQLEASLAKATKAKQAPVYTGDEVLVGDVTGPIVGAASQIEAQEGNSK